jgi:uncharacterized protein
MIDQLNKDISFSLKQGDKQAADALKMLKNAMLVAAKFKGDKLTDEEEILVVRKEIKSRTESRDLYIKYERKDLADKEEYERKMFIKYLPSEITLEQLKIIIDKEKSVLGENCKFSDLMPVVVKEVAGRLDGKTIAENVKKSLES